MNRTIVIAGVAAVAILAALHAVAQEAGSMRPAPSHAVGGVFASEPDRTRDRPAGEVDGSKQPARVPEADVAALRARLRQVLVERDALQNALQRQVEQSVDLRVERDRLAAEIAVLRAEYARITGELEESRSKLAARDAEIARLTAEVERLGAEAQSIKDGSALAACEEKVARLAAEVERLNGRLSTLTAILADSEKRLDQLSRGDREQKATIERLTARLNECLARRVEQLQQYRSEFLGRLRQVLGDHPDIRIEGDRFVLQSEILFPSGSAELEPEGRRRLEEIADTLKEIAAKIPADIDWVLRVDGHTDRRPLRPDSPYRDNWELSTARALTVVKFLIDRGIPPERLVAAGFGEYRPVDPGDSEEAYRRNRRIEFRLTQR